MTQLHPPVRYAVTCALAAASLVLACVIDGSLNLGEQAPAAGDPDVKLAGVVTGADTQRVALVSINGRSTRVVRPGDLLPGDFAVLAIDDTSLTYRHGARKVRVGMHNAGAE